ncbi:hypothetical protein PCO85_18890 [Prodigiosinella aquatilis]|nr:hypothetical protein [Prodigiosinella sp. LS101]WJV53218.1 hypothetical protein PCO85_18890 [Prodigiosinella sp. LS101]WJV57578.1 hypothetical protein PCO84_18870 [Pectobacteriaceae bacterium C111]
MAKRYSHSERQQHLDAWQHSGLTKQHYCQQHDLNPATGSNTITMMRPWPFTPHLFLRAGLCQGIMTPTP